MPIEAGYEIFCDMDPKRRLSPLPIDELMPSLLEKLEASSNLVVVAAPGAGKTTRIPPTLLTSGLLPKQSGQILMLQPRRVAARATAKRIADEQGWELGREVGYQIRFENRTSADTRLRILTEGILERKLLNDPYLEGVGCVIFDEFHERSLHSDLSLALLREVQASARPDLKILVMSATLETERLSEYLGQAPVIKSKGRNFPIDIRYTDKSVPLQTGRNTPFVPMVVDGLRSMLKDPRDDGGHVLIFLPGTGEIRACEEALSSIAREHDAELLPLHGSLSSDDQDRALRPSRRRKVILATNIAETSLTIDGVTSVIDSGLARVFRSDPRFGADRLEVQRISKDSAEQRAGRAGRQAPGRCLRLWTQHDQTQLAAHLEPEIFRVDLSPTLLMLADWGVPDLKGFPWFEPPPDPQLNSALSLLHELKAIDTGKITPEGRALLEWPLPPRLAKVLWLGRKAGLEREAAALAALLGEKDILRRDFDPGRAASLAHTSESDLLMRWHVFEAYCEGHLESSIKYMVDTAALKQVERVRNALTRAKPSARPPSEVESSLMKILIEAFPDRVSRRRSKGSKEARMVGGRGVSLEESSVVREAEFFLSLNPFEARAQGGHLIAKVSLASRIELEWLREIFPSRVAVQRSAEWDDRLGKATAFEGTRYLDLALEDRRPASLRPEELQKVLGQRLAQNPGAVFEKNPGAHRLVLRLRFLKQHMPELKWPDFDNAFFGSLLQEAVESGLDPLSDESLFSSLVDTRLNADQRRALSQEAPDRIEVPSGQSHRIEYFDEPMRQPQISVRLQEIFGWLSTPRLARGRVAITMELLSPGFKPVQTTQDLESFWSKGYAEVRKELRARYPRHSWPEDPLTAKPEAKGSRRRS